MRLIWRRTYSISVLTCLAVLSAVPAMKPEAARATSPAGWYWQNPLPHGNLLSAIACQAASACVAAGIDGSIATTNDAGQHWTNRTTGIAAGISFLACPGPTTCYALGTAAPAAGGTAQTATIVLLRSADGGGTWQPASHVQGDIHQSLNSFACPNLTTCLVGDGIYGQAEVPSILRTADGGKSWQGEYISGINAVSAIVCPTSIVCYAAGTTKSGTALVRSSDGGKTWSGRGVTSPGWPPTIACPAENTCFGVASPCNSGCPGIFLTTNGAKSWKRVADDPAGHPLSDLTCPSLTTCYALAATGSNAYNTSVVGTTTGGKTWSTHHLPDSASRIVCPGETTCFLDGDFTVLATQDGFAHTRETLAHSSLHNLGLTNISCPTTTACYAAGQRHICNSYGGECDQIAGPGAATANGGTTWTKTPAPPYLFVRLSCPSPTVCYGIGGPSAGQENFLARSRDGARTWQRVLPAGSLTARPPAPPEVSAEILYDLSCVTVSTCYVTALMAPAGFLAVLVTHDGGEHWTVRSSIDHLAPGRAGVAQTAPGPHRGLVRIVCPGIRMCFVLAATFHQVASSPQSPPHVEAAVVMLVTGDGGKTWTRKRGTEINAGDGGGTFRPPLACPTVTTCYLLLSNGSSLDPFSTGDVLVTTDGGASWRSTVVRVKAILTDIACPSADACWAAGLDGIFATADGGKTWQRQMMADGGQVPPLSSIACPAGGTCYAVGGPFYTAVTIIGTRAPEGTT